jgi:DNA-binding FadR family transcriptional regulator
MSTTTPSTVQSCAESLRDAILGGRLAPGLRLPTERALAEQFGISRATVRSALAQLEAEHLVSARQGSGYTVHDFRRKAGPDLIGPLVALAESSSRRRAIVRDLLLVRRQLARATLERLAERADDTARETDLIAVEVALDRFAEQVAKRSSIDVLAAADLECAAALVAATRSPVLQLCFNPVASVLALLPWLQRAMYRTPHENVLAYRGLLAWARSSPRAAPGIDAIVDILAERDVATMSFLSRERRKT